MAQVEFGGLKFEGGKMFAIVTALSTLGGAGWGLFEFYNDYRNMKAQIEEYVAPDMSGINQELAVQKETMASLAAAVDLFQKKIDQLEDSTNEDIDAVQTLARRVDDSTATTQRELRDDVYTMEQKLNDRLRDIDTDMRAMRKELEEKIQTVLDNPLNN